MHLSLTSIIFGIKIFLANIRGVIMKHYLLPSHGNFYKANLHTHTTISDGKLTPEETKKAYLEKGYSIVAFTDHDVLCAHNDLSDDKFLAITSFETYYNTELFLDMDFDFVRTYHLSFFAKDKNNLDCPAYADRYVERPHSLKYVTDDVVRYDYTRQHSVECINRVIKLANAKGWLVCYNHPMWSLQNYEDYGKLEGLWGVEVTNTAGFRAAHPDNEQAFVDFIRQGKRVVPVGADDMHYYDNAFGGFVMIKADKLEYDSVISAMERGDLYASNGPEIKELYIEEGILHVECSEAVKIFVNTERRTGWFKNMENELLTSADFDLNTYLYINDKEKDRLPWEPFIRVSVVDEKGRTARTRAYFTSEFIK